MSKAVKDLMIKEVSRRFQGVDSACVVDLSGLDAVTTNQMTG